jgi:hypothetical protein
LRHWCRACLLRALFHLMDVFWHGAAPQAAIMGAAKRHMDWASKQPT